MAMRVTVLASGSKGNSTLISGSRTRILVDAGLSARELIRRMRLASEDPAGIDAVLVTHEHQDHVQGIAVLARKLGIPVYFTEATHRAWVRWMNPRKKLTYKDWLAKKQEQESRASADLPESPDADAPPGGASASTQQKDGQAVGSRKNADPCALPCVEYFQSGTPFAIGDISIIPFTIPHDAADPVGFVFEVDGMRLGMATDLGYMPTNVALALRKCDLLVLESNHDLEMLREGPYPWPVKQRVLSRVGHLSNLALGEFLEKSYDGNALYIVLAHLSEKNNMPELARASAERALADRGTLLDNRLLLAEQDAPMAPLSLG